MVQIHEFMIVIKCFSSIRTVAVGKELDFKAEAPEFESRARLLPDIEKSFVHR